MNPGGPRMVLGFLEGFGVPSIKHLLLPLLASRRFKSIVPDLLPLSPAFSCFSFKSFGFSSSQLSGFYCCYRVRGCFCSQFLRWCWLDVVSNYASGFLVLVTRSASSYATCLLFLFCVVFSSACAVFFLWHPCFSV